MYKIETLHVLVGLPGSGKTYFSARYKEKHESLVIDFDAYRRLGTKINYVRIISDYGRIARKNLLLDGLFLNQEDVEGVLLLFFGSTDFMSRYSVQKIIIDYWVPNIEICSYNDLGRRDVNSAWSIQNLQVQDIDVERIEKMLNIHTEKVVHNVTKKPEYMFFIEAYHIPVKDVKYLYSESRSLGGVSYGWDGSSSPVDASEPLIDFEELDSLLEMVSPNITFLQYKRLFSYAVTTEIRDVRDYYYSGQEEYYSCDVSKLYAKLKEYGYVDFSH